MHISNYHIGKGLLLFLVAILIRLEATAQQALFTALPSAQTNVVFNNQLNETAQTNALLYQYLYNGGGVAAGDVNNDGLCDLFFTGNMVPDKLYINKGNMQFEDASTPAGIIEPTGWSTGVTMADVNADGFLDIYVCRSGQFSTHDRHNLLYINKGNGTFVEQAKKFGLDDSSFSTQAAFFDMDRDGDLDVFLLNHAVSQSTGYNLGDARNRRDNYAGNKLFRNDNDFFTDISATAGINGSPMTFGLGIAVGDINNDGYPDIFVSNDYQERDFFYLNNKNGTFSEILTTALQHTSNFSMGCDMADVNNDGFLDLMVMDMLPEDNYRQKVLKGPTKYDAYQMAADYGYYYQHMHNTLQINNGDNTFREIAWSAGVAATDWSWAPLFADFDNDGFQDLYITNGYRRDFTDLDYLKYTYGDEEQKAFAENRKINTLEMVNKMPEVKTPNYFFKGNSSIHFENNSIASGINTPSFSNGAAYADLDNDGDLDIAVNNINNTAFIYQNNANNLSSAHQIKIAIKGAGKNTFGIGTKVTATSGDTRYTRELMPTRGFQSSVEPLLYIGCGALTKMDLEIVFPSGRHLFLSDVAADSLIVIHESSGSLLLPAQEQKRLPYLDLPYSFCTYTHTEERYVDYKREPLLMHKLSDNGPAITSGDVNLDGFEDIFITGAKNKKARMFYGSADGFIPQFGGPWERDSSFEDTDALLFDADGDKDLDLYVVSGGNEYPDASRYYQDRIYFNTGFGKFIAVPNALPQSFNSKSCIAVEDFDGDGDLDVFAGGSGIPGKYPNSNGSYILENNKGIFTDITQTAAPYLSQLGNVRSATWTDITGDGKKELVIAAEWQPITILNYRKGKFVADTLAHSSGWWNCIIAADIDNDGDQDLIGGNRGTNHPVHATITEPVTLFNYDFDQNGSIDPIVTAFASDGKSYPITSRDDMLDAVPSLKKEFVYYHDYAKAQLQDLFPSIDLSKLNRYTVEEMHSCLWINDGAGKMIKQELTALEEFPVFALAVHDIDGDGRKDIIAAGNDFSIRPEFTRMDAGTGTILYNSGNTTFNRSSSLHINGEVRSLNVVRSGRDTLLMVGIRNSAIHCLLLAD